MNPERVFTVIREPHISEKATLCAEYNNQYVFKVAIDATKPEVKQAIEELFKVKVSGVTTIRSKGKVKRNRFGFNRKPNWKKAYVSLEEGHSIDIASPE